MPALKNNEGFKKRQSATVERRSDPSPTFSLFALQIAATSLSQPVQVETDATLTTKHVATDLVNRSCLQRSPFEA